MYEKAIEILKEQCQQCPIAYALRILMANSAKPEVAEPVKPEPVKAATAQASIAELEAQLTIAQSCQTEAEMQATRDAAWANKNDAELSTAQAQLATNQARRFARPIGVLAGKHGSEDLGYVDYLVSRVHGLRAENQRLRERNIDLSAKFITAQASIAKLEAELKLRKAQMNAFPFCPDHRDKVHGKPCRECLVEELQASLARKQALLKRL